MSELLDRSPSFDHTDTDLDALEIHAPSFTERIDAVAFRIHQTILDTSLHNEHIVSQELRLSHDRSLLFDSVKSCYNHGDPAACQTILHHLITDDILHSNLEAVRAFAPQLQELHDTLYH